MNNRYFGLRHGISLANEARVVVSTRQNGVAGYGLSVEGEKRARAIIAGYFSAKSGATNDTAVNAAPAREGIFANIAKKDILVLTSDFLRARQTADIFTAIGELEPALVEPRLGERSFGDFELGPSAACYEPTWARDATDPDHRLHGVESARAVAGRIGLLFEDLEREYRARWIVLVSHGDTLAIADCLLRDEGPQAHRVRPAFDNAELRPLGKSSLLP